MRYLLLTLFFIVSINYFSTAQQQSDCASAATHNVDIISPELSECASCSSCTIPQISSMDDLLEGVEHLNGHDSIFNGFLRVSDIIDDVKDSLPSGSNNNVALGLINLVDSSIDVDGLFGCFNLNCVDNLGDVGTYAQQLLDSIGPQLILDGIYVGYSLDSLNPSDQVTANQIYNDLVHFLSTTDLDSLMRAKLNINSGPTECVWTLNSVLSKSDPSSESNTEIDLFSEDLLGLNGIEGPVSPQAFNFDISNDFNVGVDHYNGLSNASVALMTFINQDLKLDLSTIFTGGSGLKIDNFGGELGQNWTLSAGGAISRKVNGIPDEFWGTNLGVGMGSKQVLQPCINFSGLGMVIGVKPKVVHWTMFRPNQLLISIPIPVLVLFGVQIYITINFEINIDIATIPARVNYEEACLGYNYLLDEAATSSFGLSNVLDMNQFESMSIEDKRKVLEKTNETAGLNDERFLSPNLDVFMSFWQGFINLFRNETIKTQRIDTEPDEYFINIPEFNGKFIFDQMGNIFTIPHSDLIISPEYGVNQKIVSFEVHTTNGLIYKYGDANLEGVETSQYINYSLPNGISYPHPAGTRTNFKAADLDEAQYPFRSPIMCMPIYRNFYMSYENNHKIMAGPEYYSKWHLVSIISKKSAESIDLTYESVGRVEYFSGQSFNFEFPDFQVINGSGGTIFSTHSAPDIVNPLQVISPYFWQNGSASLNYNVSESIEKRFRLIKIEGSGISDQIDFLYDYENPEIKGEKLCSKILYKIGSSIKKGWEFEYLESTDPGSGSVTCENSGPGTVNFSVPGEWVYTFNNNWDRGTFDDFLRTLIIKLQIPGLVKLLPIFNGIKYSKISNFNNISLIRERSSVLQIKAYHFSVDLEKESEKWISEHKRSFLKSIKRIGRDDSREDYIDISYDQEQLLTSLPKKFSPRQDLWGYYNNAPENVTCFPSIKYTDNNGILRDQSTNPNVGLHIGLRSNGAPLVPRQEIANLDACKIGSLKKVDLYTGASYEFEYESHDWPVSSGNIQKGAGLRVNKLIIDPGVGDPKVITYEYFSPAIVTQPQFKSQSAYNTTGDNGTGERMVLYNTSPLIEWQMNKSHYVGYGEVHELYEGNGRNEYTFTIPGETHVDGFSLLPSKFETKGITYIKQNFGIDSQTNMPTNLSAYLEPYAPLLSRDWLYGLPLTTKTYTQDNQIEYEKEIFYSVNKGEFKTCIPDSNIVFPIRGGNLNKSSQLTPPFGSDPVSDVVEECDTQYDKPIKFLKTHSFQRNDPGPWAEQVVIRQVVQSLHFESSPVWDYIEAWLLSEAISLFKYIEKFMIYANCHYEFEELLVDKEEEKFYFPDAGGQTSSIHTEYKYIQLTAITDANYFSIASPIRPVKSYVDSIIKNFVGHNSTPLTTIEKNFYAFELSLTPDFLKVQPYSYNLNQLRNLSCNFPLRKESFYNSTLTGGGISSFIYIKRGGKHRLLPHHTWGVVDKTFVLGSRVYNWNNRGKPTDLKIPIFNKSPNLDQYSIYSKEIDLVWSNEDLLEEKTVKGGGLSLVEKYQYTALKELASKEDVNSIVETYTYDQMGRLQELKSQNNLATTVFSYSFNPNIKTETTTFSSPTPTQQMTHTLDGFGKLLSTKRIDDKILQKNLYDNMFRLDESHHITSGQTDYFYRFSPNEQVLRQIDAEGNQYSFEFKATDSDGGSFDNVFQVVVTTDPNGYVTKEYTDGLGRNVGHMSGEGGKTKSIYDEQGRIKSIVNPIGEQFEYEYNGMGKLSKKTVPTASPEVYKYNDRMEMVYMYDGNNNTMVYEYDGLSRLKNAYWHMGQVGVSEDQSTGVVSEGSISNYYSGDPAQTIAYVSGKNQIQSISDRIFGPDNDVTYKNISNIYDNYGRVDIENNTYLGQTFNINYTYNGANLITQMKNTFNGKDYNMSTSYDAVLRPVTTTVKVADEERIVSQVGYNDQDLPQMKLLGQSGGQNCNVGHLPLNNNDGKSSGSNIYLQQIDYEYDLIGRLIQINNLNEFDCPEPQDPPDRECNLQGIIIIDEEADDLGGRCYIIDNFIVNGVTYDQIWGNYYPHFIEHSAQELETKINTFLNDHNFTSTITVIKTYISPTEFKLEFIIHGNDIETFTIITVDTDEECLRIEFYLDCCNPSLELIENMDKAKRLTKSSGAYSETPDLFYEKITYDGLDIEIIEMYNGCEIGLIRNDYGYDQDHRVTSVINTMFDPDPVVGNYNESMVYDEAGNLAFVTRSGFTGYHLFENTPTYGAIDELTYEYSGNSQLTGVTDAAHVLWGFKNGQTSFTYDGKGNILTSSHNDLTIAYNSINLPKVLSTPTGNYKIWTTFSGEKLKVESQEGDGPMVSRLFLKALELEGEASGTEVPTWYHFGDGKVRIFSGQGPVPADPFVADYYLKDHLGNIMVVFRDDNGDCVITTEEDPENREVIERYMYYAFGMQWDGVWRPENNPPDDEPNRYRYNSKEWHFSTGMLDYGFRYYMPEIGRFSGVDPLADQMPSYSPYTYTFNNPILLVDPDGLAPNCEGCPDPTKYKEGDKTIWGGKEFGHDGDDWSHTLPEVNITDKKPGPIGYALSKYADAWTSLGKGIVNLFSDMSLHKIEGNSVNYPTSNNKSGSNIEFHSEHNFKSTGSIAHPEAKDGTKFIMSLGGLNGPFGITYETLNSIYSKSTSDIKSIREPVDTTTSHLGTRIERFKTIHNPGRPDEITTWGGRILK